MDQDIVIKVEDLSKLYRLGQVGTGTLSHDLKRWWALTRGKEDPYLKIGIENDRTLKSDDDYAWALKNISFEIEHGDTIGVIGKNGAGKSTLLKLLSRVTAPTMGNIKIKGRIATLLEVGTGFHPELTGKENIYMNGAILGMSKREIASKFDEIVDFAGVALYLNTPVKRYSSGMYVRLAFAVAAHLEPEILIVDEVLAVGDAEFQKKCLGKMGDAANHGRTIIFVSHNMQAIQSLCKKTIYLKSGRLVEMGQTEKVINNYLSKEIKNCLIKKWDIDDENAPGNEVLKVQHAEVIIHDDDNNDSITISTSIDIFVKFKLSYELNVNVSLLLFTATGNCVFNLNTDVKMLRQGFHEVVLKIPGNFLNDDMYYVNVIFVKDASTHIIYLNELLSFEVVDIHRAGNWYGKWLGTVRPTFFDFKLV